MRGGPGACSGLAGPLGVGRGPHLALGPAVLSDRSDPAQHVIPVLSLKEIFTEVSGGQPEHVPPLGLAVGDVHQAGADADGRRLVLTCDGRRPRRCCRPGLPPLLAQREGARPQRGIHPLPLAQAAARFLQGDTSREEIRGEEEGVSDRPAFPPQSAGGAGLEAVDAPVACQEPPLLYLAGTWSSCLEALTLSAPHLPGHPCPSSSVSPEDLQPFF